MPDNAEDRTLQIRPGERERLGLVADVLVHTLSLEQPDDTERHVPIGAAPVSIGRVEGNTVVLAGTAVSRRHCVIALAGEDAVLTDAGSTNGTFVDGLRVTAPVALADGARIRIGPYALRYQRRRQAELEATLSANRDLQRARNYVDALLPAPIRSGPVQAAWCFRPCATLGGDAFGYQMIGPGWFTAYMLDVSGHGLGAAMLSVSVMNVLRQRALPGVDPCNPAAVLAALNAMFDMDSHHGLFFTLWYGVYHLPSRQLSFAAAGHHPAFLCLPGVAPLPLATRNPAIGMRPEHEFIAAAHVIPPAGRLVLFSDGAFEVETADGAGWSMASLLELLRAPEVPGLAAPDRIWQAVRGVAKPGPLADDFSVLELCFG